MKFSAVMIDDFLGWCLKVNKTLQVLGWVKGELEQLTGGGGRTQCKKVMEEI
jgi:hypothetical protein